MIPASVVALMKGVLLFSSPGATLAAAWRAYDILPTIARTGNFRCVKRRARAISAARLNGSPRLQLRPIDQVFCLGPYRKENSSRRRLPT